MKYFTWNWTSKSWLMHKSMISHQWNWILSCDITKQLLTYIYPWNKVLQDENQRCIFIKLNEGSLVFVYCLKCMKVFWRERCSVLEHLKTKSVAEYCCFQPPPIYCLVWTNVNGLWWKEMSTAPHLLMFIYFSHTKISQPLNENGTKAVNERKHS